MIFEYHPKYGATNVKTYMYVNITHRRLCMDVLIALKPPLECYRLAKTLVQRLAVCDAAPPGLKMATLPSLLVQQNGARAEVE